jgi:predicted nuclease of restriction endonuclease-like (RecB) superfamily
MVVVAEVANALTAEFGRGFSKRNLNYMVRFAEVFAEAEIVHALRSQLSWTHFRELIPIDDPLKRRFYTELCRVERWSTRTLKSKMDGMLFERTAFRDPYVLDFLGLPSDFSEAELEAALLRELDAFLLELGHGFSFIARQKRMSIGADDYYLDLLFFHRPLRALVAIELELGRFDARDKGQMELYVPRNRPSFSKACGYTGRNFVPYSTCAACVTCPSTRRPGRSGMSPTSMLVPADSQRFSMALARVRSHCASTMTMSRPSPMESGGKR